MGRSKMSIAGTWKNSKALVTYEIVGGTLEITRVETLNGHEKKTVESYSIGCYNDFDFQGIKMEAVVLMPRPDLLEVKASSGLMDAKVEVRLGKLVESVTNNQIGLWGKTVKT